MRSDISLYSDRPLTIDRNFAVDDIEDYLENHGGSYWHTTGNYFKHSLNASILLELKQEELDFNATNADSKNYNYCAIYNYNIDVTPIAREETVYYFIIGKKWRSKQVVELELYMDTISTLGWLKLTDRTLVHREHRDRYDVKSSTVAIPIIDKISEGINPILYKDNEKLIAYEGQENTIHIQNKKWYLVYYNNDAIDPDAFNQSNPVNAEFFLEGRNFPEGYNFAYSGNNGAIRTMSSGDDYLLIPYPLKNGNGNLAGGFTISINNTDIECYFLNTEDNTATGLGYRLKLTGSSIVGQYCKFTVDGYGNVSSLTWLSSTTYSTNQYKFKYAPSIVYGYSIETDFYNNSTITKTLREANTTALAQIDSVDRTDSRIIKIIEFPYCPIPIEMYDSYTRTIYFKKAVVVGGDYYGVKLVENNSYNKNISVEYSMTGVNAYPSGLAVLNPSSKSFTTAKDKAYETKLFNSEIYNFKIVYDSFSNIINFENIELNASLLSKVFTFNFIISKNFSSTFILDYSKSYPKSAREDYSDILIVKRNNEVEIFTSQYINYLRNGYNYDVKSKETRHAANVTGLVLAGIGGIAGTAIGIASGNPAIVAGSMISAGTAITSNIVNTVQQSITSTQAIESKTAQMKAQAISVSQCDELSLLDYYTISNKAKLVTYKPSNSMQNNLFNMFYYTGYKTEAMKVPVLDSRIRFNFIQADIDIELVSLSNTMRNISDEILKDYKARFAVGLTIFHKVNNTYDFEQQYENWEKTMKNYLS